MHDEWNMSGLFPDGSFAPVFLLTKVPAMIADQHNPRFPAARILLQVLKETTNLPIHKGNLRMVCPNRRIPLIAGHNKLMVTEAVVQWLVSMSTS